MELGARLTRGEHHRERTEFVLESVEDGVDGLLVGFGDEQFGPTPGMREPLVGQRLGEGRDLVGVPAVEVVMDDDRVGIVRAKLAVVGGHGGTLLRVLIEPARAPDDSGEELAHEVVLESTVLR